MSNEEKRITALRAIRAKCLDCCGGSKKDVRECMSEDCKLWVFRFGKNPLRRVRHYTAEERAEIGARLANARRTEKE